MARRKKNNTFINILLIVLIVILGIVIVKAIDSHRNKQTEEFIKTETKKSNEVKNQESKKEETSKNETKENTIKPSSDEKTETENEVKRKGGNISLEIKGEDEITIKKGSNFTDPGFKATYEDGSDASSEVKVEGSVDTNKEGTYTISYSAGNTIIMRRVTVE